MRENGKHFRKLPVKSKKCPWKKWKKWAWKPHRHAWKISMKGQKTFHAHSWFSREKKALPYNLTSKKSYTYQLFCFHKPTNTKTQKPANYQLQKTVNLPTFKISQTYQLKISKTCKLPTFFSESGGDRPPPDSQLSQPCMGGERIEIYFRLNLPRIPKDVLPECTENGIVEFCSL